MKIETLKSRKRKYFLYVLVLGVGLLLILNLTTTKAKYKTVESIPIVKGTIKNYSPYDFKLIAVKIENESGEYETTDTIPTSGYILNMENSYCTIPDGNGNNVKDDSITIEYIDGLINFLGMSKRNTKCTIYFDIYNEPINFDYTGGAQTFIVDLSGNYQIELWGASGTSGDNYASGKGSYTKGNIFLNQENTLYLYLGEMGIEQGSSRTYGNLSFNGASGGSYSCKTYNPQPGNAYGGGATDIRFFENIPDDLSWDNNLGLASRLMVAAGGASVSANQSGANGGGIKGYDGNAGTGGTQTSAGGPNSGSFGKAGVPPYLGNTCNCTDRYGAGSGYYGGGASNSTLSGTSANVYRGSAGSGSSFISGHTGCVAIKSSTDITPKDGCTTGTTDNACSIHYSGKTFTDTLMIDGAGYSWTNVKGEQVQMPNPQGGYYDLGVGHTGNGYARITYLGK